MYRRNGLVYEVATVAALPSLQRSHASSETLVAMNSSILVWIIAGVVALIVIAAIIIVLGLKRSKAKQISFEKKEEIEQKKPDSGNYQAQGGFNFTAGGGSATKVAEPVEKPAPKPEPAPKQDVKPEPKTEPKPKVEQEPKPEAPAKPAASARSAAPAPEKAEPVKPETKESSEAKAEAKTESETEAPAKPAEPDKPAKATPVAAPVAEPAESEPAESEPTPEPAPTKTDDIAPVQGRLGKLRGRMSKSQNVIGRGVLGILSAGDLDEDAWEEIEDTLLMADLGTKTTLAVVEDLRERIAVNGVSSEAEAREMLRASLIDACKPDLDRSIKAMPYDGKPAVIMVVGVNGTGKTTTTGKLSRVLVGMGHKVMLGAADTFRAAAADQLETWGRRVGAETVRGKEGADPASVAFDAVAKGTEEGVDVVVIDTAGRLHTSVGLMDQLGKVKRVVEKKAKVDEVLLVLDATVGQNGLTQARVFREVVDITGVVLTKLDGTAKGGIVFQVQEELGVPVKLVGLGEGADHLAPFEVESFVDALLG